MWLEKIEEHKNKHIVMACLYNSALMDKQKNCVLWSIVMYYIVVRRLE